MTRNLADNLAENLAYNAAGAGSGDADIPAALADVLYWWNPTDAETIDLETGVALFTDTVSGVGVPQASAAAQPAYDADGSSLNHGSLVYADTHVLGLASLDGLRAIINANHTLFAEFYFSSAPAAIESVFGVYGGASRGSRINITTSGEAQAEWTNTSTVSYQATGSAVTATKTWAVLIRSGTDLYLVQPGGTTGPVATAGNSNSDGIYMGGSNKYGLEFSGEIGHCGIFASALAGADLTALVDWLDSVIA